MGLFVTLPVRAFSSRPEAKYLRRMLLARRSGSIQTECACSLCSWRFPTFLLETAHLRPRHTLHVSERRSIDCVELMCRMCHCIYDNGHAGVHAGGNIVVSGCLHAYPKLPIHQCVGRPYPFYSVRNEKYFRWHYENIFTA